MAALSESEKALLKKLQAKAEAPDEPSVGRSIRVDINLGDEKQVKLAKQYGLLPADADDGDGDDGDGDGDDGKEDEKPRRRSYFE